MGKVYSIFGPGQVEYKKINDDGKDDNNNYPSSRESCFAVRDAE